MQLQFNYGQVDDIVWMDQTLLDCLGHPEEENGPGSVPIHQLVGSIIAGRTRDQVSMQAFIDLLFHCRDNWSLVAAMTVEDITDIIGKVTRPEQKAAWLKDTLQAIEQHSHDFNIDFLADMALDDARSWLQNFGGIGPKVAAAIMNFSTLDMPIFIVDTHVLRVLFRFGLIGRVNTWLACRRVTGSMREWRPGDFRRFHCLVKQLGQQICTATHAACRRCPLADSCQKRRPKGW